MSCRYCGRADHNARNCPEVPRKVSRPLRGKGHYRLDEAEARIAALEVVLRKVLTGIQPHMIANGNLGVVAAIIRRAGKVLDHE